MSLHESQTMVFTYSAYWLCSMCHTSWWCGLFIFLPYNHTLDIYILDIIQSEHIPTETVGKKKKKKNLSNIKVSSYRDFKLQIQKESPNI